MLSETRADSDQSEDTGKLLFHTSFKRRGKQIANRRSKLEWQEDSVQVIYIYCIYTYIYMYIVYRSSISLYIGIQRKGPKYIGIYCIGPLSLYIAIQCIGPIYRYIVYRSYIYRCIVYRSSFPGEDESLSSFLLSQSCFTNILPHQLPLRKRLKNMWNGYPSSFLLYLRLCYVAQDGFELTIFLPRFPECQDNRCMAPGSTS